MTDYKLSHPWNEDFWSLVLFDCLIEVPILFITFKIMLSADDSEEVNMAVVGIASSIIPTCLGVISVFRKHRHIWSGFKFTVGFANTIAPTPFPEGVKSEPGSCHASDDDLSELYGHLTDSSVSHSHVDSSEKEKTNIQMSLVEA